MERKKIVDRKEMIEVLEHCKSDINACKGCPRAYYKDWRVACEDYLHGRANSIPVAVIQDVIDMLKEQEPMMVRLTASTIRCPKCGKQITSRGAIHREIKFCWKCGRAVKWDETD